jgi:hypothetical protein
MLVCAKDGQCNKRRDSTSTGAYTRAPLDAGRIPGMAFPPTLPRTHTGIVHSTWWALREAVGKQWYEHTEQQIQNKRDGA